MLKQRQIPYSKRLWIICRIVVQFKKLISDGEILFRYAKASAFPEGQDEVPPFIFNDIDLSCDWNRFQLLPERSFHIAEGMNVIVAINVSDSFRNPRNPKRTNQFLPEQIQMVHHSPLDREDDERHGDNYSHALIQGRKRGPVTVALAENARIYAIIQN